MTFFAQKTIKVILESYKSACNLVTNTLKANFICRGYIKHGQKGYGTKRQEFKQHQIMTDI